jgi:hypothetical protein
MEVGWTGYCKCDVCFGDPVWGRPLMVSHDFGVKLTPTPMLSDFGTKTWPPPLQKWRHKILPAPEATKKTNFLYQVAVTTVASQLCATNGEGVSKIFWTDALKVINLTTKRVWKLPTSTQLHATWHTDSLDSSLIIYWRFALPQQLYRWRHQFEIFWIYPCTSSAHSFAFYSPGKSRLTGFIVTSVWRHDTSNPLSPSFVKRQRSVNRPLDPRIVTHCSTAVVKLTL